MMTKATLVLFFVTMMSAAMAQVTTVDIVRVKGAYEKEALYFYENNWKVFRQMALEEKYISGFDFVKSPADSTGLFTIVLVTQFADDASYKNVESNFRGIMQKVSPAGPKMLNSVTRKEFIVSTTSYGGNSVWRSKK
jgi:hypothetical protein